MGAESLSSHLLEFWWYMLFRLLTCSYLYEALVSGALGSILTQMPLKLVCHMSFYIVSKY